MRIGLKENGKKWKVMMISMSASYQFNDPRDGNDEGGTYKLH